MEKYLNEYKYYLNGELKLSKNTIEKYNRDTKKYIEYLTKQQKITNLEEINIDVIRAYLKYLKRKVKNLDSYISSIRSFHRFLFLEKHMKTNPANLIDLPKKEKKLPVVLSIDSVNKIIDNIDISQDDGYIAKAMIETTYSCGLRVSELTGLKIENLHLDLGFIKVFGKGSKERIIPIGEKAVDTLNYYLKNIRPRYVKNTSPYVFLSKRGKQITRQTFSTILKKHVLENDILKKVSPHTLRHSFASHMLQEGSDLRLIQELLGHENISTTEIYTHVSNSKLKEVYLNAHPRARKDKNNV